MAKKATKRVRSTTAQRSAARPRRALNQAVLASLPEPAKSLNRSLHAARAVKQDEFYTQLPDIEKELRHYTKHFEGKTVLCNCDDPKVSNFFRYFSNKFHDLKLKQLVTTCYRSADADLFSQNIDGRGLRLIYRGELTPGGRVPAFTKLDKQMLKGDGDFQSPECIALLKQADVVVTNPPFSLFRQFVTKLVENDKKFIIIGSMNAITYKEIFSLIKANKLWLGNGFERGNAYFATPAGREYAGGVYDPETGLEAIPKPRIRW
jgi:hypothetical protein